MLASTRSLKKCEPSETSGTTFMRVFTISQIAETRWISANVTGTPSATVLVPHRPGPRSRMRRVPAGSSRVTRPTTRATS